MQIAAKKIIGLAVETKSGQKLGRVRDFKIASDTLEVKNFFVRPAGLVKGLTVGDLIIGKNSIISVDEEKLIVDDSIEAELVQNKGFKKELAAAAPPISASLRE